MMTAAYPALNTRNTNFFVAAAIAMTAIFGSGFGCRGLRGMVNYGMLPPRVHLREIGRASCRERV